MITIVSDAVINKQDNVTVEFRVRVPGGTLHDYYISFPHDRFDPIAAREHVFELAEKDHGNPKS